MVTINIENRPFQHWVEKCSDLFEDSLKPLFFVSLCAFSRVECQGSLISTIHSLLRCHVKRTIKDTNLWQVPKVLTSGECQFRTFPARKGLNLTSGAQFVAPDLFKLIFYLRVPLSLLLHCLC